MPVKRRVGKARPFDDYHRQQLLDGPDALLLAGQGYFAPFGVASVGQLDAEQHAAMLEAMRADWTRYGPGLMAWWRTGEPEPIVRPWAWVARGEPDTLPWAAEEWGEP